MTAAIGTLSRFGLDTVSPVTKSLAFVREDVHLEEHFVDAKGLTGSRGHPVEGVRAGTRRVVGSVTLQPTPTEWSYILPWVFGAAPTGNGSSATPYVYALQEALGSAYYLTFDRATKVLTYSGCQVARMTVEGSQGEPLRVELEVVGVDETVGSAGTFPAISNDLTAPPFMFQDCVITANAVTYNARSFRLVLDQHLEDDRWLNSATLTGIYALDRTVECPLTLPYGDASALYGLGTAGFAVDLKATNGTHSLEFNLPSCVAPRRSPTVPGRQEVFMDLPVTGKRSGSSTLELTAQLVL